MIRQTLDATFLNTVANDPQVRPWLGAGAEVDLTSAISNPANVALVTEGGGWLFHKHEASVYELHTLFMPAARGRACLQSWKEAERYMFVRTDAKEIITRVPANNRGADFAARHCGFRERFTRKSGLLMSTGERVDVSYRALTIDDWWTRDPKALALGEAFHATLEAAGAHSGHPQDETHDRAVGGTCLMFVGGAARKGIWFYNRWAVLAGYAPIRFLSEVPLLIDIGDGTVVTVDNGQMEVVRCPQP